MAHETQPPKKKRLAMENGRPTDADECNGEECRRPTSHPSGECSQCREGDA